MIKEQNKQLSPKNLSFQNALKDWLDSGISEDVVSLNFNYVEGFEGFKLFIDNCKFEKKDLTNTGVSSVIAKKYNHLYSGYWYVNTFNPITKMVDFAQTKPNLPRTYFDYSKQSEKIIKYETPKGANTPFIFLNIPMRVIKHLAKKYKIESLPLDNYSDKWQWIKDNPQISVSITEGVKKAAALISVGIIAVASFSVTTHSERVTEDHSSWFTELKPELKWLLENKREVFITFDRADQKLSSKLAVNKQTKTLGKKLSKLGNSVKIIDWSDSECKGIDDYLVKHGIKGVRRLYQQSISYRKFTARLRALGTRKLSGTIKINEKHFPSDLIATALKDNKKIIGVKSAQNTGKTTAIAQVLKSDCQNKKILNITHRQTLSRNLSERLGLNSYQDDLFIHLQRKVSNTENFNLSICLDSLLKLDSENTYDIIVLDEISQILWHGLNAKTEIKKNRGDILERLFKLLSNCVNNGGTIICSDADLSDIDIKFLSDMLRLNLKAVVCFENEFKPFSNRNLIIIDSELKLRKEVIKAVEKGERIIISTSGQKVISSSGTINLEQWLLEFLPEDKIYRIDQETVSNTDRKECGITDNLNRLKEAQIIIHSNTISTGVSLDIDVVGKIDKSFGIFWGNYPLDDFEQSLERYRGDCDRYVFLPESRCSMIANGSANHQKMISHFDNKLSQTNYIFNIDQFRFASELVIYYSLYGSRINGDLSGLRSNFIVHCENKGYNIMNYQEKITKKEITQIKEKKQEIKEKSTKDYAQNLWNSSVLSNSEYEEIKSKKRKSKKESLAEKRTDLNKRYGNLAPMLLEDLDLFTQFVIADLGSLYPQLRRRFFCSLGSEINLILDREKAQKKANYSKENDKLVYFSDLLELSKNSIYSKTLEILGISIDDLSIRANGITDQQMADLKQIAIEKNETSKEWQQARDKIKELAITTQSIEQWSKELDEKIEKHGTAIETALDIDLSLTKNKKNKAMVRFRMILNRLGYDLESCFRSWENGKQLRYYRIKSKVDQAVWEQIYENWYSEIKCQELQAA
ncbi:plasmid replication protein, CyRepA1 family [Geminocystis sp. NIES-3709]|uniref:plasmid replication protein, CyRepA1 family n=1 Tax=Geminocystis sp. NIES-3709 TaxID=1617448 RepID=UPI0005FCDB65|nr:plasmid replication protein, CyRepA1 family [Geminocystis sp. NIES-3709]BAQ67167.1 hypothetical protein GM3709_3932 [Geminocystis sp. NIES-3709]